jgi:hypothetical protein
MSLPVVTPRPSLQRLAWAVAACCVAGCEMSPPDQAERAPNRLSHEKSPYLLQHAHNPVDWYPWGQEAFARARREQKPIFLSIGYSTCHWCHVMAHESFENEAIAALLNRSFVSIKVDREEHPDVDHLYMTAVQAMTGRGGWPLTVFLTPDLKPFFGGTYFPPARRWDMPGMDELLPQVANAWQERRTDVAASADRLTESLSGWLLQAAPPGIPDLEALHAAFREAVHTFDPVHGGFGDAPKFPRSHELSFLLRYAARTGSGQARDMAVATLEHLQRGGIYDHLGGGFHRYSTDAAWLVPHFEKMLYDQALLARAYTEAYQATGRGDFAATARGILDYVLRDLAGAGGGFFSAEDADSEGEEGQFYVWTPEALAGALGADAELFGRFYGVTPEGNFEHGASILHIEQPLEAFAVLKQLAPEALPQRLADARARLLQARARRVRPHRDDKVLTSWNGLMIASLASAGSALEEPRYLAAARRAADFIDQTLWRDGRLLRRFRDGDARYAGTLEDYAFLAYGRLALYEAGWEIRDLRRTQELLAQMLTRFWDETQGGFRLLPQDEPALLAPIRDAHDGATPSGNSIAALVLLRAGRLLGDSRLEDYGRRTIEAFAASVARSPWAFPQMLIAWDFALGPTREVVIAGDPADPATQQMRQALHRGFRPHLVTGFNPTSGDGLGRLAAYAAAQRPLEGRATAYVCADGVCRLPTASVDEFQRLLDADAP